jgi:GNAT superfamily N-acetyltransferase
MLMVVLVVVRRVSDPADAALGDLSRLMDSLFGDPDVVLDLERMRTFLMEPAISAQRQFRVLVAEEAGTLLGGTVFSYVPASNCGFSEYLVVRKSRHGQGLGRQLVDARRAELDEQARRAGRAACNGVFIEADNPERTPAALVARERETAMDSVDRLRLFAHLGFYRVDMAYVQPALGPGKQPVSYLDLLFGPWDQPVKRSQRVPAAWVYQTVAPIWESWAHGSSAADSLALRDRLTEEFHALRPLL